MFRVAPLVAVLASIVLTPAAYAQDGAGLYEPFPSGESTRLAKRYLGPVLAAETNELSSAEIRRGVFIALPRETAGRAASVRAGRRDQGGDSLPPVLSIGIVALAVGGGFALAYRRR